MVSRGNTLQIAPNHAKLSEKCTVTRVVTH